MADLLDSLIAPKADNAASYTELIKKQLEDQAAAKEASALEREKQLQVALENYKPQYDLSGLAAGIDAINGTHVGAAVKPGEDKDRDLIEQLMKEQRAEPKGGVNAASLLSQQQKQDGAQGRFDVSQQNNFQKEIQGDLEKDIVEPLNIRKQQFDTIQSALDTDDYVTIGMTMSQFARGVAGEKGVLTDNDVARVFPNTATNSVAKLSAYLTGGGKIDPASKAHLKQLLDISRANATKVYNDYAKAKQENYQKRNLAQRYGVFKQGGYGNEVFKNANEVIKGFSPEAAAPAPDAKSSKVEAILQQLRNKK